MRAIVLLIIFVLVGCCHQNRILAIVEPPDIAGDVLINWKLSGGQAGRLDATVDAKRSNISFLVDFRPGEILTVFIASIQSNGQIVKEHEASIQIPYTPCFCEVKDFPISMGQSTNVKFYDVSGRAGTAFIVGEDVSSGKGNGVVYQHDGRTLQQLGGGGGPLKSVWADPQSDLVIAIGGNTCVVGPNWSLPTMGSVGSYQAVADGYLAADNAISMLNPRNLCALSNIQIVGDITDLAVVGNNNRKEIILKPMVGYVAAGLGTIYKVVQNPEMGKPPLLIDTDTMKPKMRNLPMDRATVPTALAVSNKGIFIGVNGDPTGICWLTSFDAQSCITIPTPGFLIVALWHDPTTDLLWAVTNVGTLLRFDLRKLRKNSASMVQ